MVHARGGGTGEGGLSHCPDRRRGRAGRRAERVRLRHGAPARDGLVEGDRQGLEVFVEEGKAVRKGQVLARLDDSQVRAALAVAEAQLETARQRRCRGRGAAPRGRAERSSRRQQLAEGAGRRPGGARHRAVPRSSRSRRGSPYAQQQVDVAESQVTQRQTDLADMVVRAPFDGVAISKDAQPGEMISPVSAGGGFTRTGICTIVDMSSLEIEVDVNESYINRVQPAQPVEAVLDAYPDWRIPAHVITTVPTADRQKATVRVRIGFGPSTSLRAGTATASGQAMDPRILPDMGVKVSFLRDDEPAPAATAPRPRDAGAEDGGADRSDGTIGRVRGARGPRRAARGAGRHGGRRPGRGPVRAQRRRTRRRRRVRRR